MLGCALFEHGLLLQPPSSEVVMCQLALATQVSSASEPRKRIKTEDHLGRGRWEPPTAEGQMVVESLRRQTHVGNDIRST